MIETPKYLFAEITNPPDEYRDDIGDIKYIVLFGMMCSDGEVWYLEIRYIDFEKGIVEGDSLTGHLEDAYRMAYESYGIKEGDWRNLTKEEFHRVDDSIN